MGRFNRYTFSVAAVSALSILMVVCSCIPAAAVDTTGSVGTWTTSSNPVPVDVSGAGAVTYNGYAYVLGGSSSHIGHSDGVYYAKLGSDGSVGSWATSPNSLPHTLYYPSAVMANGYIYVMGGHSSGFQDAVYYAKINSDGSIGSWVTSPNSLPQGIYEASAVTHNGYIYFMGGENGSSTLDTVYSAKINNDGSVGSWTLNASHIPQGVFDAAVTLSNNRVYLLGGDNGSSYKNTIYYAGFNSDGSVGSWTTDTTTLPQALDGPTAASSNGYLYLAGGNTDSSTTQSTVSYAKLNDNGSVGSWVTSPNSLPQPLRYSASLVSSGYLYVLAGQNGGMTQDTAYYASLAFTSQQSATNAVTSQPFTLNTPAGTNITSLTQAAVSDDDSGYGYPLGLASFTFATDSVENQISLTFQTGLLPGQVTARKYTAASHTYSSMPGAVITETTLGGAHALLLTYTIADGGPLDGDGAVNGIILDPIGLAQPTSISAAVTAPNTGYGHSAPNWLTVTVMTSGIILLAGAAAGARILLLLDRSRE